MVERIKGKTAMTAYKLAIVKAESERLRKMFDLQSQCNQVHPSNYPQYNQLHFVDLLFNPLFYLLSVYTYDRGIEFLFRDFLCNEV